LYNAKTFSDDVTAAIDIYRVVRKKRPELSPGVMQQSIARHKTMFASILSPQKSVFEEVDG